MQTLLNYRRFRNRRPFDRRFFCFAPVWCASMLPGVEYFRRAPFAPFLVSRCCQAWSIAAVPFAPFMVSRCCQVWSVAAGAPFAPFLVPQCCQVWSVAAVPFAPVWCLPGDSMLARYTHYSKSQKLEFLPLCPLLAAHYRLYRVSQILGNCKQM